MADEPFLIKSRRADDVVAVTTNKDATVFDVKSPFGISQTTITRTGESWPKVVIVRLRLKGLESFAISNGKTELAGTVGIRDGKPDVRLWQDRDEDKLLDEKGPMRIRVAIVDEKTPSIPLKMGAFELTLPAALFEGNVKSITVRWIDFYR